MRKRGELGFDDFGNLYQKLIFTQNTLRDCFDGQFLYSKNGQTISQPEFQKFLIEEQKDSRGKDEKFTSNFIREYVGDATRDLQAPYLTISEFIDFLFSKQNEIWTSEHDKIFQDMTRPLSHYWISSSHNTYLTGDQFSSDSSLESYVRALRQGCRCIELDCWDGPDNMPHIYHGHTLTSKIKFMDVIRIIKEHAFATSEFPVILSIEQNCSLAQQRRMAQAMQEVFGDMLLTQQVEKNESKLPSPYQLRRKIILKHKKLPEFDETNRHSDGILVRTDENDLDVRKSLKSGILYLKNEKLWNTHFFVLTHHKLFYSEYAK